MTGFSEEIIYMLTDMTSVQLNLIMVCFLPFTWYIDYVTIP